MKLVVMTFAIGILSYAAGYYGGLNRWLLESSHDIELAVKPVANPQKKTNSQLDKLGNAFLYSENSDFANLPVVDSDAYAGLLEKLDKIPQPIIDEHLQKHFGAEQLEKISNSRAFAKRLLEVALETEETAQDHIGRADIYFYKSPIYGKNMLVGEVAVSKYEPLFAHIVTEEKLGDVIVKWQDLRSGEVLLFKGLAINSAGQYISAVPRNGWNSTLYQVSLSSMDEAVNLMASSVYAVTQVSGDSDSRGPNYEVIEDLVSIGQAVPKVRE
jgi:hypothetical protein